jgi:hypothetical protein
LTPCWEDCTQRHAPPLILVQCWSQHYEVQKFGLQ